MDELDLKQVDLAVGRYGRSPDRVIPILQDLQRSYRYLPEPALRRLCEISEITPAAVEGVSSFYSQFRHRPMGKHLIKVCDGTACHVKGSNDIIQAFQEQLGIPEGEDTDTEGEFTLQKAFCLGCCTLAPVAQIDDITYGHLTNGSVEKALADFRKHLKESEGQRREVDTNGRAQADGEVRICLDSCCVARGCGDTHKAIYDAVAETGIQARVKRVACVVMCERTPMIEIALPGKKPFVYSQVPPADVRPILLRHFKPAGLFNKIRTRISTALDNLLTDETWEPVTRHASDVRDPPVAAFFGQQKHIATEQYGILDPGDIEEYQAHDGFRSLRKCLEELSAEDVIAEIKSSGLRGRGGAGFPTAVKWDTMRKNPDPKKFVICNGDEGDPGAFMDRMLMESFPFRVIEGLAIAAYAVGADEGILYIRSEYPFAVQRIRDALEKCRAEGILGPQVMGTDFGLKLELFEGAGAFVCGEETAMLESIEGRRGIPRMRPPYPVEKGLFGHPTLINNVETLALLPWIFRHGAEAFASFGTPSSKGTKVFALAGKIRRGGLIEVPMGVTIKEVVEDIGGGVPDGRKLKAVLIGGPSGGCVPARLAHTRIDYESLREVGAIMGSGGLVVLDDTDCMVSIARYFLSFCQYESCGKCTFCRVGTRRMLDILERLCTGKGRKGDIEDLESLAGLVKQGSLCGLGKTAPNPVVTSLRYFHKEFEAHLEGRCPAGRCQSLITYSINEHCIGCTLCSQHCPVDAIPMAPYQKHQIMSDLCTRCDTCRQVCPEDAVDVT